jgi:hypothetical protein
MHECDHRDGDKRNNSSANLFWVIRRVNMNLASEKGLLTNHVGEDNKTSKLTNEAIIFIRNSSLSLRALAKIFGVDQSTIYHAKRGFTWRHVEAKKNA